MTRRMLMTAGLSGAVTLSSWAPGGAASPAPTSSTSPAGLGSVFASPVYPYTMTLPSGWRPVSGSPQDTGDLFEGPNGNARVGSHGPVPGQSVADRVAANRAELGGQECTSDPADDQPATLGSETAIAWNFACGESLTLAINTIYEDVGYRLSVTVPTASEEGGPALLDEFAGTFTFTTATSSPGPSPDLAAIDASLQGTWRTEWAPVELWLASVKAAGLDPDSYSAGSWAADMKRADSRRGTVRFEDGQMVEYAAFNGGADEFGSQASYHLVDQDTIEARDPTGGPLRIVYDFTLRDDVLSIDVVSDTDPTDLVPQTSIYETLPFTRVP